MKIIHTSDLHIGSPLTSRLSKDKVRTRQRELLETFSKMANEASLIGARAFIIAGDLFDSENITKRERERVLSIIEEKGDITFLYLPGNHEGRTLANSSPSPKNLLIFGEEWTYFDIDEVTFSGRSRTESDMFKTLKLNPDRVNIAVLHGALLDRSGEGGVIGKNDASGKSIDYIALGHYHKFSYEKLDNRTVAVYSGVPEGRGFDEVGECGYVEIDTSLGRAEYKFRPFAKRRMLEIECDISENSTQNAIIETAKKCLLDARREDIVRLVLTGTHSPEVYADTELIAITFERDFFHFEVKDTSRLVINAEDYRFDKSLKGEFIRLVYSREDITEEEKDKIIRLGLGALMGEVGEI